MSLKRQFPGNGEGYPILTRTTSNRFLMFEQFVLKSLFLVIQPTD